MRGALSIAWVVSLCVGALAAAACNEDDCQKTLTCPPGQSPSGGAGGGVGAGTSSGGDGGAPQDCGAPADCTGTLEECDEAFDCVNGACQKLFKDGGEPCNQGTGICSGEGFCGECVANTTRCGDGTNTVEVCTREGVWDAAPNPCSTDTPVCSSGACQAITELALGTDHHCALLADGKIRCWGENANGQLGNGVTGAARLTPVEVVTIDDAVEISGDSDLTCARRADDSLWCWGKLYVYNDVSDDSLSWVQPTELATDVSTFVVGANRICYVANGGTVSCMGDSFVELDDGDAFFEFDPANAGSAGSSFFGGMGVTNVRRITMGFDALCVLTTGNQVLCAGDRNAVGNSSLTTNQPDLTPITATPTLTGNHVLGGGDRVVCTGTTMGTGDTFCFGQGADWQENGTSYGTSNMSHVAVGYNHFCALDTGQVVCRGACNQGQCGTSEPFFLYSVTPVLAGATKVWAGGATTCARKTDGSVLCWGAVMQGTAGPTPTELNWID